MFYRGQHDVFSAFLFLRARAAEYRPIVAFRTARGKINFIRLRADKPRKRIPRAIHRAHRRPPESVRGIGVAEKLRIIRTHFFEYVRI